MGVGDAGLNVNEESLLNQVQACKDLWERRSPCAEVRLLDSFDIDARDVLKFSVALAEPKILLGDVKLDLLEKLPVVGFGSFDMSGLWLMFEASYWANPSLGVKAVVSYWGNLQLLCGIFAGVPQTEGLVVEDKGCTGLVKKLGLLFSGHFASALQGNPSNSPPLFGEERECSLFGKIAVAPEIPLVDGVPELFIIKTPSLFSKHSFWGNPVAD